MLKKILAFVAPIAVAIFVISCPILFHSDITEMNRLEGKKIINYPVWLLSSDLDYGNPYAFNAVSKWFDWNSEEGNMLRSFLSSNNINSNYSGKFRIEIREQYTRICFNDADSSNLVFYNWIGDIGNTIDSRFAELLQDDIDSRFSYDCIIKFSLHDSCDELKKSHVTFLKTGDISTFRYNLEINNTKIIDCDMYNTDILIGENSHIRLSGISNSDFLKYFPYYWSIEKNNSKEFPSFSNDLFRFFTKGDLLQVCLYPNGRIYSYEGIEFRNINEDKTKISFNLLDATESDFADYFEIHVKAKDDVSLTFYKFNSDNEPIVVRAYSKPELEWEWQKYYLMRIFSRFC